MSPTTSITVAGLCGSLRDESYTRVALRIALDAASESGAVTELLDLRDFELPVFRPDRDEPAAAAQLKRTLRESDAVILGSPMYHGSYSSPLKTALDYCGFDEFEHKTIGLLAVSGGQFPVSALDHLRSVCRALDAWVLPYQTAIPDSHSNFTNRKLVNDELHNRVVTLGQRIVRFAVIQEIDPASFESLENKGA